MLMNITSFGPYIMLHNMFKDVTPHDNVRGVAVSFIQTPISVGYVLQYSVGPYVSYVTLAAVSALVSVALLAAMFCVSGVAQSTRGQREGEEALASLQWLRNGTMEEERKELRSIQVRDMTARRRELFGTSGVDIRGVDELRSTQVGDAKWLRNKTSKFALYAPGREGNDEYVCVGLCGVLNVLPTPQVITAPNLESRSVAIWRLVASSIPGQRDDRGVGVRPDRISRERESRGLQCVGPRRRSGHAWLLLRLLPAHRPRGEETAHVGVRGHHRRGAGHGRIQNYIWGHRLSALRRDRGNLLPPDVKYKVTSLISALLTFLAFIQSKFFLNLCEGLGTQVAIWMFEDFSLLYL
ncbi:unnamed protein product [Timema podura]|uniref:Uncharacterized protein n=1 Tax=Timema podura TaxID=61482 RepID=A0ABN7NI76_TIMPD|nr:unnamed protein product [Timema podura]